ncbi:NAD(P)-binding protein [Leucosporidium creatinivorum]|uniref:NAD(P)-binding protein n=1 Tax=Leucosporidium creatinivorum TaxID=106004 RepID=A0A1Y2D6T7_9BASI|nr:NAD(P)-binding protein [Leucosporidium creatinivorum]
MISYLFGNLIARLSPEGAMSTTFFPPSPKYDPSRDIPDLTGKIAIVTGGNSGVGYETVKQLLLKNARVYLAARTQVKAQEAIEALAKETGNTAIWLKLDLGDLESVKQAAAEFSAKEERLIILFCNAGVMVPPVDQLTKQGYDLQFGTNVVGHYLLCVLLYPSLNRTFELTGSRARVIHTSSEGHRIANTPSGLLFEAAKGGAERDALIKEWGPAVGAPWTLYGFSKMGNVLIANIFNRAYPSVMSCTVHPGGLKSNLHQHEPLWQKIFFNLAFYPVPLGAYTQLWAGTSEEGDGFGGKYLFPWARMGKADARAAYEATQDELKGWLDEEIKAYV